MCEENSLSSLFAFLPSSHESSFDYRPVVIYATSVIDEFFPFERNWNIFHQFRHHGHATSVSLNCSDVHQFSSGILATFDPCFVASITKVISPIIVRDMMNKLDRWDALFRDLRNEDRKG